MRAFFRAALGAALSLGLTAPAPGAPVVPGPGPAADDPGFVVVDGDTLWLADPLVVVGSRVPAALPGLLRPVGVLGEDALGQSPGLSPSEWLQTVPGVVSGRRQPHGVQSDLTIRGSTFEQVQVLLDGYDLGDAQTGHHLLDLPVTGQDVARLEVLPGHGSALYGSGAFGGTVNVVTRAPAEATGGTAAVRGGSLGTWGLGSAYDWRPAAATGVRISAEATGTDGYDVPREDGGEDWGGNDARSRFLTGRVVHDGAGGRTDLFAGFADRKFGALDFYAPYPSWEETRTLFVGVRHNRSLSRRVAVEPRLYLRRHTDRFVLLRSDPDVFTNDHVTRRTGLELRTLVDLGLRHAAAVSLESAYEDIDSRGLRAGAWQDALGSHVRRRVSVALEVDRNGGPGRWQLGGRMDGREGFLPRYSGTAAAAVDLTGRLAIRGSLGSMFRVPTFTELYYVSAANLGNPDLRPEKGWAWEGGLDLRGDAWSVRTSYFERHERDLIDWARPREWTTEDAPPWQVLNVAEARVRGIETGDDRTAARGHALGLGWTWLEKESAMPEAYEGKYALLAPRHVLTGRGYLVLSPSLGAGLTARYLEHTGGPDPFRNVFVLDGMARWDFARGRSVRVTVMNLLDRRYQEVPGIFLAGTTALVEFSLSY